MGMMQAIFEPTTQNKEILTTNLQQMMKPYVLISSSSYNHFQNLNYNTTVEVAVKRKMMKDIKNNTTTNTKLM